MKACSLKVVNLKNRVQQPELCQMTKHVDYWRTVYWDQPALDKNVRLVELLITVYYVFFLLLRLIGNYETNLWSY